MSTTLCVFGGKSTALEIAETARRFFPNESPRVILAVPDMEPADGEERFHAKQLRSFVASCSAPVGYIISMWDQKIRQDWMQLAQSMNMVPRSVVHPSVYISQSARIGAGVYLAANAVVSCNAIIADHVIVNYSVTVGHDSTIGSHCFLNPGARLSGNVNIGQRVLIGSNAFIFQGVSVADDCLIDAMTYVDRDIEPNMICSSKQLKVLKRVF